MSGRTLKVEAFRIRGICPVYREGDTFLVKDGYELCSTHPLCLHALALLMPYYTALSRGTSPKDLGLAREGKTAYVQCLDPCERTGGGTVVFAMKAIWQRGQGERDKG